MARAVLASSCASGSSERRPDGVHGTVLWYAARAGGAPAAPYPVSVLAPRPPSRGSWVLVSLSNVVMPHKSLRQGHTPHPPAKAIGLTDHVWSYREYSWLPAHADPALTQQLDERILHLLTPALQD